MVEAVDQVQLVSTCIGGWARPVRAGFEVVCLGEADTNDVRGLLLMRVQAKHGQLVTGERVPIRGLASDLRPYSATIGRGRRFVLSADRASDRTGEVFELRRDGTATSLMALPAGIAPKFAVTRGSGECRAWAGERTNSRDYDVYFARDADDPGVLVYTSSIGVGVLDVDCAQESVWLLVPRVWDVVEVDRDGAVLGEHPTGDIIPHPLSPGVDSVVRGRCSLGVFDADLRVYCGHAELGSLPVPTQVGDVQLELSEGMDEGGFIAFQAPVDRYVLVHEVAPDGLVGDWLTITIPGDDPVVLRGVVANRKFVCARWTVAQQEYAPPAPVTLACIPRP